MSRETRENERVPVLGALVGDISVLQPMAVREISRGGVQVETRFPIQIDSLHELRLTLGEHTVVVKGRVIHCRLSDVDQDSVTYCSGLEFVEPSEHVEAAIVAFLEMVKAAREPA